MCIKCDIEWRGVPAYSKVLNEKMWNLKSDQNTPVKEVLSPM